MASVRIQAATIPYRPNPYGGYEVLLVSASKGGWGLPKGGVKRDQTPQLAARLESLEATPIPGELGPWMLPLQALT